MKKGGVFGLEIQEGGHEFKEERLGDDPNTQIHKAMTFMPLEVQGINLVP